MEEESTAAEQRSIASDMMGLWIQWSGTKYTAKTGDRGQEKGKPLDSLSFSRMHQKRKKSQQKNKSGCSHSSQNTQTHAELKMGHTTKLKPVQMMKKQKNVCGPQKSLLRAEICPVHLFIPRHNTPGLANNGHSETVRTNEQIEEVAPCYDQTRVGENAKIIKISMAGEWK